MSSEQEIKDVRKAKLQKIYNQDLNPYPAKVKRTHSLEEVEANFDALYKTSESVSVIGRVMAMRGQGAILFIVLKDDGHTFQAVLKKDELGEEAFSLWQDTVDMGDFVGIEGSCAQTKKGHPSIFATTWRMASKSLLPLPDKWHGLQDDDLRYRKRYLDILSNDDLRQMFVRKSLFWKVTRQFLEERGFLEVQTPTLEVTTGGAEANPFKTHHDDFDIDVFLRISVGELWQKHLMAAGFAKTFEIGRVYRNEGSSPNHLQEFTNMECYWAYADMQDGMKFVQDLYQHIALNVYQTTTFTTRGFTYDLAGDWPTVDYTEEVLRQTGIDIMSATAADMREKLTQLGVEFAGENKERMIDNLWKYCRKNISGPVFLVGHPKIVSPLSKEDPQKLGRTLRFQPIIAGAELGNAFAELNDPVDQRDRFKAQAQLLANGDNEAMMPDWEFVEMLEHGMPPTFGFGFGERLFAFFEDQPIRETTLFPLMKPKQS